MGREFIEGLDRDLVFAEMQKALGNREFLEAGVDPEIIGIVASDLDSVDEIVVIFGALANKGDIPLGHCFDRKGEAEFKVLEFGIKSVLFDKPRLKHSLATAHDL